jgi:hypothetical protein
MFFCFLHGFYKIAVNHSRIKCISQFFLSWTYMYTFQRKYYLEVEHIFVYVLSWLQCISSLRNKVAKRFIRATYEMQQMNVCTVTVRQGRPSVLSASGVVGSDSDIALAAVVHGHTVVHDSWQVNQVSMLRYFGGPTAYHWNREKTAMG